MAFRLSKGIAVSLTTNFLQLFWLERESKIEKDNMNLLAKMEQIKKKGTAINVSESFLPSPDA